MIPALRAETPDLTEREACRLLAVNRSSHQRRSSTAESVAAGTQAQDVERRDSIESLVLEFPGYGYRRVTKALERGGLAVNHKRVLRVMRQESLLCQLQRRFKPATTDSRHAFRRYPNLVKKLEPGGLDQVWHADITYIRLGQGFVYRACVLDGFSRRCVGWALSPFIDTSLTLEALSMAFQARQPAPGLIYHSDQGVQYANERYVARLEAVGARPSVSASGNPYENAKAERFFRTLKGGEVRLKEYESYQQARADIGHFISSLYNEKRLHSSLGYVPPVEFEATRVQVGSG